MMPYTLVDTIFEELLRTGGKPVEWLKPGQRVRFIYTGGYNHYKPKGADVFTTELPEFKAPEPGQEYVIDEVAPARSFISLVGFPPKQGYPVRHFEPVMD
jgi:hypothetical protein